MLLFRTFAAARAVHAESWLFDLRHGVHTRATRKDRLTHDESTGFWYLPTRPSTARAILRELPVADHSKYAFIDFGSGKGRMLMLAGEYPFAIVQGVEYNKYLHQCAQNNLLNTRNLVIKCQQIESLNLNACEYEFPEQDLVLYFFNPFGPEIMGKILSRLRRSLDRAPRDVIVVSIYSDYDYAREPGGLTLYKRTGLCNIYRS